MPVEVKTEEGAAAVSPQAWQPGLTRLARSLSKENLGSLARVGDKLSSVKKSGEQLMLTAQGQVAKLAEGRQRLANDLGGRGVWDGVQAGPRPGMRRSASEMSLQRSCRPLGSLPASRLGQGWTLARTMTATKALPLEAEQGEHEPILKVKLPELCAASDGFHTLTLATAEHAQVGSAPVAWGLPSARFAVPIRSAAQETLGNCQRNMQALKRALTEQAAELECRLRALAERCPGARPGPSPDTTTSATGAWAGVRDDAAVLLTDTEPGPEESWGRQSLLATLLGRRRRRRGSSDAVSSPTSVLGAEDEAALTAAEAGSSGQASGKPGSGAASRSPRGGSSLREPGRRITIVTTASLPWRTGTAVNPLLRAAYLARDGSRAVTLLVPWLAPAEQARVFPEGLCFGTPGEQEAWVRAWVAKRTGFTPRFRLGFYPARYAAEKCSILPVGDPSACVPQHEADVAVLEEPEHLTWYHHGARWSARFRHVVGVVHTNYLDYARREENGAAKAAVLRATNALLCAAHCHRVIKLSDAVQPLPRAVTRFVHGVPDAFLEVGRAVALARAGRVAGGSEEEAGGGMGRATDGADASTSSAAAVGAASCVSNDATPTPATPASASQPAGGAFGAGAYFIGKVVWGKGYQELLDLVGSNGAGPLAGAALDCFGSGEDAGEVEATAVARGLPLRFLGPRDHLDSELTRYRCLVNPSTSDVVATTSAEALAMGKWLVCADLPCNSFFTGFRNCLVYRTPDEFGHALAHALAHDPAPLTPDEARSLSWEAATERFLDASELAPAELRPRPLTAAADALKYALHNTLTGIEPLRAAAGAGVRTRDAPARLDDFDPSLSGAGGLFDSKRRTASTASVAASVATPN